MCSRHNTVMRISCTVSVALVLALAGATPDLRQLLGASDEREQASSSEERNVVSSKEVSGSLAPSDSPSAPDPVQEQTDGELNDRAKKSYSAPYQQPHAPYAYQAPFPQSSSHSAVQTVPAYYPSPAPNPAISYQPSPFCVEIRPKHPGQAPFVVCETPPGAGYRPSVHGASSVQHQQQQQAGYALHAMSQMRADAAQKEPQPPKDAQQPSAPRDCDQTVLTPAQQAEELKKAQQPPPKTPAPKEAAPEASFRSAYDLPPYAPYPRPAPPPPPPVYHNNPPPVVHYGYPPPPFYGPHPLAPTYVLPHPQYGPDTPLTLSCQLNKPYMLPSHNPYALLQLVMKPGHGDSAYRAADKKDPKQQQQTSQEQIPPRPKKLPPMNPVMSEEQLRAQNQMLHQQMRAFHDQQLQAISNKMRADAQQSPTSFKIPLDPSQKGGAGQPQKDDAKSGATPDDCRDVPSKGAKNQLSNSKEKPTGAKPKNAAVLSPYY